MTFDEEFQLLSTDNVGVFGKTITYRRTSGGTFSTTTGTESGNTTISQTFSAIESQTMRNVATTMDSGQMLVEDVVYLIDAATFQNTSLSAPAQGDIVISDGVQRRVSGVNLQAQRKMYRIVCKSEEKPG